ncbi:MAG TPA: hypothetical protein VHK47_01280 [Polyangia bacterium]|jgi:hypothetical protein|nr:hypothetical protein [Polyangia bacterium]
MRWQAITVQYPVETLVFIGLLYVIFYGITDRSDPRRVLVLCAAINLLRIGSGLAALFALSRPHAPAYLVGIAFGDFATAALALATIAALLRASDKALIVAALMNGLGLMHLMVSEAWTAYWEHRGIVGRTAFLHVPTIAASFYSAVHICSFYFIARAHHADHADEANHLPT